MPSEANKIRASVSGVVEISIFATPDDLRQIADLLEEKARTTDYGGSLTAHTISPSSSAWARNITVHFVCDQDRMDCKHEKYRTPSRRSPNGH